MLGERRIAFLDPDGPTPRDTPPGRNGFPLAKDGDGWDLRGRLDNEATAILRTALSPLSGHHHTVIDREWTVTLTDDHPLFHPPPWTPGGPRRNTLHRIDLPPRC